MATVPQKELRNNVAEVLRRAESGERITITVAGRPVAELGPTSRRRWVGGSELAAVWATPEPESFGADLAGFTTELGDPFA